MEKYTPLNLKKHSFEWSILTSFKGHTNQWQIIDAAIVWEVAIRLGYQGLLENSGLRFRLTEEGKELCEKIQGVSNETNQ
jgi:hypothetical protein